MDYCAGGNIRTLLKPGRIDEKYISVIARELLIALQFIHKEGVIHIDLKAANVLVTKEGKVKLCDFGVAAQLTNSSSKRSTMAGTPYWMAPEVILEGQTYNVKADIWSLGITIYEVATGNPPHCDKEAILAMQMITKTQPSRLEGNLYSSMLKEFVALCLDEQPNERLPAEELLKLKFIKNYKNIQTSILKDLISRYVSWKERQGSRDSMSIFNNKDDEFDENNDNDNVSTNWDFGTLNSHDIDYDELMEPNSNQITDSFENTNSSDYYNDSRMNSNENKENSFNNDNNTTTLKGYSTSTKEGPKSLLQLFETTKEDDEQLSSSLTNLDTPTNNRFQLDLPNLPIPSFPSSSEIMSISSGSRNGSKPSSPTIEIEIPSMDSLSRSDILTVNSSKPSLTSSQSLNIQIPLHSNNVSLSSPQPPPLQPQKPFSQTQVSSPSSISSNGLQQPHDERYRLRSNTYNLNVNNSEILTESPLQAPIMTRRATNPTQSSASVSLTSINGNSNGNKNRTPSPKRGIPTTNNINNNNSSSNNINIQSKNKPPLMHLNMPTNKFPISSSSTTISNNNSINNTADKELVNQFGIMTSQTVAVSMTPLTEKSESSGGLGIVLPRKKPTTTITPGNSSNNNISGSVFGSSTGLNNIPSTLPSTTNGISNEKHHHGLTMGSSLQAGFPANTPGSISSSSTINGNNGTLSYKSFPPIPNIDLAVLLDYYPQDKLIGEVTKVLNNLDKGLEVFDMALAQLKEENSK